MGESDRDTLRVHFDARVRLEFHGATIRGGVSQRIKLLVHELARQRRIHRGGLQRSVSRGLLYRGCGGKTWRWEWGTSRALLRRQRLPPARLLGVYCPYKEVPHYPLTLSPVYFMKIQPDVHGH